MDRAEDAVIVRSPIEAANFLFRAPKDFAEQAPEEPFLVDLKSGAARIRLRITSLGPSDPADPDRLAAAREADYRLGQGSKPEVEGQGARRLVRARGGAGARTVLLVVDGARLYELFLDGDEASAAALEEVARGFTILDPKGGPAAKAPTAEELKERVLEHDFYRLEVLKPAGFSAAEGDPNKDAGIWMEMRRIDEDRSQCDIRIRTWLKKALEGGQSVEDFGRKAIARFEKDHIDTRVPKAPPRTGWPGAHVAYKLKLAGRTRKGITVQEDCRIVDHENGRIYEFQVTMYGGASRSFQKEIAAFWKKLRITGK